MAPVSVVLLAGFLAAAFGWCSDALGYDDIAANVLNYDVEADLVYIDLLKRPQTSGSFGLLYGNADGGDVQTPRALGLEKLRLGLTLRAANVTSLTLVFRPDAVSAGRDPGNTGTAREFDSRAGESYQPSTPINLLDAYQLAAVIGPNLEVSYGVHECLAKQVASYPQVMEFGLNVRFPQHISGLMVSWRNFGAEQPTADPRQANSGVGANIVFFQGDGDRAETLGEREKTFDTAPVAADPYYGLAVQFEWITSANFGAGLLTGFDDATEDGGKRHEIFVQGSITGNALVRSRALRLTLDLRWLRETFRVPDLSLTPREQSSASLTVAIPASTKTWYLLGFHLGKSERDDAALPADLTNQVDGYQIETGLLGKIGKGLSAVMLFNHELRKITVPGSDRTGAFIDGEGNHATLRRFALELRYILGGSL